MSAWASSDMMGAPLTYGAALIDAGAGLGMRWFGARVLEGLDFVTTDVESRLTEYGSPFKRMPHSCNETAPSTF